jgi:hypothetical protein
MYSKVKYEKFIIVCFTVVLNITFNKKSFFAQFNIKITKFFQCNIPEAGMNVHIHKYKFDSDVSNIHVHTITGYASSAIGFRNFHFHFFHGVSTYIRHTHYFSGITSLPIKTENGHIHKMEGLLKYNDVHEHKFSGYTFEDVGYISSMLVTGHLK